MSKRSDIIDTYDTVHGYGLGRRYMTKKGEMVCRVNPKTGKAFCWAKFSDLIIDRSKAAYVKA